MTPVFSPVARAAELSVETILDGLTRQQHLHPHRGIGQVMNYLTRSTGLCSVAATSALRWLSLDPDRLIGRLRRTELAQLAQCIHRRVEAGDCAR